MTRACKGAALAAIALAIACGGDDSSSGGASPGDGGNSPDGGVANGDGSVPNGDGGTTSDGSPPPPATTCALPIQPEDTSHPTTVVGTGTPASCTEAALDAAIQKAGVITFNCGGAATIAITTEKAVSTTQDTVLDGGGTITLDAGGKTRIFKMNSANFRATRTKFAIQHIALANAKSTGTPIPQAPPPCSQGFDVDGGGAAIYVRDGVLHVVDVTFTNGAGASPGPDVAGGGIYTLGSLETIVVGSRFVGNSAANGGAVGSLNSDLKLVNNVFDANKATGTGANYIDNTCKVNGGESGNGGNGGAVSIDGGSDGALTVCGNVFTNNQAGALGTLFRTPDNARQTSTIDQCTFDGNTAKGGGALYFHHSDLVITRTTFSNNSAEGAGAIQADDTNITFENDTFYGNSATKGLGGAMSIFGNGGTIKNCTFASNHADAGSGYFAAAIAGGTTFTIDNTIFWNNTSKDPNPPMTCASTSGGAADLQWPKNHDVGTNPDQACVTNITFADAALGSFGDNGGPTKTLVPASSGPAAGIGKSCPATDQRGHPRKMDGCTAGAVELP